VLAASSEAQEIPAVLHVAFLASKLEPGLALREDARAAVPALVPVRELVQAQAEEPVSLPVLYVRLSLRHDREGG
jgi:hypothetical protein